MLTIRPQPRAFMPGSAARMLWNDDDRLIAMIRSQASGGKSSIAATCWIPALLTRMSRAPKRASTPAIMAAISSGTVMSASE